MNRSNSPVYGRANSRPPTAISGPVAVRRYSGSKAVRAASRKKKVPKIFTTMATTLLQVWVVWRLMVGDVSLQCRFDGDWVFSRSCEKGRF